MKILHNSGDRINTCRTLFSISFHFKKYQSLGTILWKQFLDHFAPTFWNLTKNQDLLYLQLSPIQRACYIVMEGNCLGLAPFVLDKSLLVVIHDHVLTRCCKKFDELTVDFYSFLPSFPLSLNSWIKWLLNDFNCVLSPLLRLNSTPLFLAVLQNFIHWVSS